MWEKVISLRHFLAMKFNQIQRRARKVSPTVAGICLIYSTCTYGKRIFLSAKRHIRTKKSERNMTGYFILVFKRNPKIEGHNLYMLSFFWF